MAKKIILIIIALIIIGSGTFYGGMKYRQSKNPLSNLSHQNFQNLSPEQRQQLSQGRTGAGAGANNIFGEIIAKDEQSLTIKMPDGGSKIIFFSDSTEISKFVNGASNDLEVGKTISVNGTTNQDGSLTAKSIQLRPISVNQ